MTSRNPTPRPRKVAGRATPVTAPQTSRETASPGLVRGAGAPSSSSDDAPPPARRTTIALVAAIVVLVGIVGMESAYLWGPLKDDSTVSTARPVLLSEAAERSAVDVAAQAAARFSARSFETYDEQVDAAAKMMTVAFAEQFRKTTDQVKEQFLADQTEVTVTVEAQSVMTASPQQVEALIFLTQYTSKKGEQTAFTPFRIKVTLIDTDQGWLVSAVDTA